jgi:phage-related protein
MEINTKESGEDPQAHGHRENFLNRIPIVYALRSRIDKWDIRKLQSFGKAKNTVNRTKWQPTDWEKIFTNPISNRRLISNIQRTQEVRLQRIK